MDLADFREIWLCDFEFSASDGERPTPVCMVAREFRTGRLLYLWRDQLQRLNKPPIDTGPSTLIVAYFASAELGCFLALDWPMPSRILDLYAEFRCLTSGLTVPCGNSLLGALGYHGLDGLAAVEKESMRALALGGGPYTEDERQALLNYCQSDVDALGQLLPAMLPKLDLPRALLRGRYMAAVARMEWTGIPIDAPALNTMRANWTGIQDQLIQRIDAGRGIYDGRTFKAERFAAWLVEQSIPWPRLESGTLDLSDDCFHEMGRAYPDMVSPIRELRTALSRLRLESLAVGSDGRNRCLLSPFGTRTSRNTPSNSEFIFGPSTWLRGLIRPEAGKAIAYVDWEQQEFGIAAALSGDPAMMEAYRSSDPYLTFAKQAGAVPPTGTRETHHTERERFKVLSLAVQYGMGADSLARRLDESPARGRELLRLHRQTYPRYWQWSDAVEMTAMLTGRLQATFGWTIRVGQNANPRSLRNFPLQANGAEMLRLACMFATERGIQVCAPIHDALLVEGPIEEIEAVVTETQKAMREASEWVLPGFPLRTDAKIVRWPERYSDPRGERFWRAVWQLIGEHAPSTDATPTPSTDAAQPLAPAPPPSCLLFSSLNGFSKNECPPTGQPGILTVAGRNDGPTKPQTETAAILQIEIPSRADPVGLAYPGNGTAGPGPGRGLDTLAGILDSEQPNNTVATCSPARSWYPCGCCTPSDTGIGNGRTCDDSPAAGPLPESDDPRFARERRQTDLDTSVDEAAEREAIQEEGCTCCTPAELAELVRVLVFP
jgi:hypothetical protein